MKHAAIYAVTCAFLLVACGCGACVTNSSAGPEQQCPPRATPPLHEAQQLADLTRSLYLQRLEAADIRATRCSQEVVVWSRRLCLVELRAAASKTEAAEAAERHRNVLDQCLRFVEQEREQGRAAGGDLDLLRYYLAEANLWLAEAQHGLYPCCTAE